MKNSLIAKERGFTLVELAIVIVVLGIIALAVTFFWPDNKIYTTARAQQLSNDLRYMQNLAATRKEPVRINFASTQYSLTELDGTTPINHPGSTTNVILMPSGVTLSTSGLPNNYLVFGSDGRPYTSTSIPSSLLSGFAWILISGSGRLAYVLVSPQTGMVFEPIVF